MKERVQHIGRIKGLLATQGIRDFWLSRRDWAKQLNVAITSDGRPLPPQLTAEIGRHCQRLALGDVTLKAIDAQRDIAAEAKTEIDPSEPQCDGRIQRLAQLKGIGP